jgi:hypothetical protein
LIVHADHDQAIPDWQRAIEVISGTAVLYTTTAMVFSCCLSDIGSVVFNAIVLNVLFIGGFIANAVLTRHGGSSCSGIVNTPLGIGNTGNNYDAFESNGLSAGESETPTYSISPHTSCRLNTAAFAVSIIATFVFMVTTLLQVYIMRERTTEKRIRPSVISNHISDPVERNLWKHKKVADIDLEQGASGAVSGTDDLAVGSVHNGIHPQTSPGSVEAQSLLLATSMIKLMIPMDTVLSNAMIIQLMTYVALIMHNHN